MTTLISPPTRFLVIGCGHTGTTLVSGILHINGYGSFDVSRLFESTRLNEINERIIVGAPDTETDIREFLDKLERRTRGRWCLKDPRLSETAGSFYPLVDGAVGVIFNFRDPGSTVRSLIKEREMHEPYLTPGEMLRDSENEWLGRTGAALRFLDEYRPPHVLFVSYDSLVDGHSDHALCRFVGCPLDMTFIDPSRRHSRPVEVREELLDLHRDVVARATANWEYVLTTTARVDPRPRSGPTLRTRVHVQSNRVINGVRRRLGRVGTRQPTG